ncbi:MAG: transporter [Devosia sp.]
MGVKLVAAAAAASAVMVTGALAQDGPRAYQLLPTDTKVVSLTGQYFYNFTEYSAGLPLSTEVEAYVFTPRYTQVIDVGGNAGAVFVALPMGSVTATADLGLFGTQVEEAGFAVGDLVLGGVVGIVGAPAMTLQEFMTYQPGFQAGVLAKLTLPTGAYDAAEEVNLGGNRWTLQAGLPMSYSLGSSALDPELMTFELLPSVTVYGDNTDPAGAMNTADVVSQDPLFALEGHITRNFGQMVWASLDGFYQYGGETSNDGVGNDDATQSLSLGATVGVHLAPNISLEASYDEVVYSNIDDSTSRSFRLASYFRF